eukprot:NODE_243_length_2616_cov_4.208414_g221_i0.p1 GENE.NODE_243_length_2616_cov_4.208414_g221_i0~~NODE_243_length_2616_cov_4.208414_g221_i0.p1  ORF type:complete len:329 (-),score=86.31 NODE_243_length_2616_cov_4.208414_g221_i0:1439-2425(-)
MRDGSFSPGNYPGAASGAVDEDLETMARQVLEQIATAGTTADIALDDYIHVLSQYRTACERCGNYQEAELVQQVVRQLRLEDESRHISAIAVQQENERQGLEEAHMLEFQNFNRIWNEKIASFEEHQLDCEASMLERHSAELADFHGAIMEGHAHLRVSKFSKELLNMRKIQETLARQKNYPDAHKIKIKADKVEAVERERMAREQAESFAKKEAQILSRHKAELTAMRKRMDRGRDELERARKRELEMLLRRYRNVRAGLLGQQNILKAKTGNILGKHAENSKREVSGASAIQVALGSGAFGLVESSRPASRASNFDNRQTLLPPIS